MKIKLEITYDVNAQHDETKAEEERVMDLIQDEVKNFAGSIAARAKAEGMNVTMEGS